MKRIVIWLFVSILFTSCTVSRTDRYPGKQVASFPSEMIGEYHLMLGGFQGFFQHKRLDSVRMRISTDRIESLEESGWKTEYQLDSQNVLSQYQHLYFLSERDKVEQNFWHTNIIWKAGREIRISPLTASDKDFRKDKLKNYLRLTWVSRSNGKTTEREILPGDKELLQAAGNIPENSKDSLLYYKMDEVQLLRYFKREVNAKNTLRFEPIDQVPVKK